MNNTALGAEKKKEQTINFISEAHEKFYYEKLKEVRYQDVYHKALCYCLGISDDTRRNINSIYDFKTGCVKTECLHEGWQTSGSMKVVRMAFNLYCNSTPSACGDCGRTTQKGYVEILEFTHFVELFSFNRIAENHKEKELVRKVTVVVALDLGCGNTKNSEYESK